MTPFGQKIRDMRSANNVTLSFMANEIGVSAAYLSALERGRKGRPSWYLIQRIIAFFNIIWDDAEELIQLANLSHPRVSIDTSRSSASATFLANELASEIMNLRQDEITEIQKIIEQAKIRKKRNLIKFKDRKK